MDDEVRDYYFPSDDDLDAIVETPQVFEFVPVAQRIEALHHANDSAKRLDGTVYYEREHGFINRLLDDIVGR